MTDKTSHIRDNQRILHVSENTIVLYGSINAAKKASRQIAWHGNQVIAQPFTVLPSMKTVGADSSAAYHLPRYTA